jgi:hypothetical protein
MTHTTPRRFVTRTENSPSQSRPINDSWQTPHVKTSMPSLSQKGFLEVVAKGRGMTVEHVRQLAKGRVYSGRQALEVGAREGAAARGPGAD